MTESPRWERESQEPLGPSPAPEQTVEFDLAAAGLVDPEEERRTRMAAARMAAARESLAGSLTNSRESLTATRESLSSTAGKVGRWFAALDRRPEFDPGESRDPIAELNPGPPMATAQFAPPPEYAMPSEPPMAEPPMAEPPMAEPVEDPGHGRFPTAALGYNRQAVDRHVAELETVIDGLRVKLGEPVSISEEIERLGEQTSAILVVAHDKASETARRAQEQAARAVREASRDAERITADAERRLRELDEETDAVWQERERLLDDVRVVSSALASLADDASERFPAAPEMTTEQPTSAQPHADLEPEPASA
jgi:cell division septum initiation protein DivIVA